MRLTAVFQPPSDPLDLVALMHMLIDALEDQSAADPELLAQFGPLNRRLKRAKLRAVARARHRHTLAELAGILNITAQSVSAMERKGKAHPRVGGEECTGYLVSVGRIIASNTGESANG